MDKKEKDIKWKVPKKRQPVWRVVRPIVKGIAFGVKNVEFVGEKFPEKCIIVPKKKTNEQE